MLILLIFFGFLEKILLWYEKGGNLFMFISLIRTIILYLLVLLTMRLMGKRQVGQLEPFELTVAIMISDLASLPMQDTKIPLVRGVIPIITLLILECIIALLQNKSRIAQKILTGTPSILIENGKLDIKQMNEQKYNIYDLFEEIRLNGYLNISDIQYAILETSGKLSIIPKIAAAPVVKSDLSVNSNEEKLPVILIRNGKINYTVLKYLNKNEKWLNSLLKQNKIKSYKDLFIAMLDSKEKFFYQYTKDGEKK